jgi:hypothetical protein
MRKARSRGYGTAWEGHTLVKVPWKADLGARER